jgi:DNA-binding beta-propeller fold protein YncE/cytochrome c553
MEVHVHDHVARTRVGFQRVSRSLIAFALALPTVSLSAAPALALTLEVSHPGPSVVGEAHVFTATATEASGAVTYTWTFGESAEPEAGGSEMPHTFGEPGHYTIIVGATDASGDYTSEVFQHMVHHPLTAMRPTSSTSIIYDAARNRVYSLNQDNDSVTSFDADALVKLGELPVYRKPESLAVMPDGKLWVVHQDDYAIAVVDLERFEIERGFRLPYASQPVGVALSPTGDAAYVSLMALGKLLKLDPSSGETLGECDVGPRPRGIAVSHDGKDVYVTRFISPDTGGEVVKVDGPAMQVSARIALPLDTTTMDNPQGARGLPNYLFSVALTPDGRQAWVPGKKDNFLRGKLRSDEDLTHDTMVRPLVAVIDAQTAQEIGENRVDLDDRSLPVHVDFTPFGNLAIITLGGSNRVEFRDVYRPAQVFTAITEAGLFPRASVLAPNQRLFVQGSLSRDVRVYDVSAQLERYDTSSPLLLETMAATASEKLSPEVLAGKRIFHDSEDARMANEGYLSCGVCHFEGTDDGRVWDFTERGEGLRNTMALLGRKGTGHGRLNWSGNLDEIQDFEHQIRDLFGGTGFLPEEMLSVGTRNEPLGDPKAGLSADLDALASYVASLDHANPSPYRNPDGSLTADGLAGRAIFSRLGCDFCHGGSELTDSARGSLHDVGTLSEGSGMRAGEPLFGIDTPTLLGVWETPPYLHDGSAPTLRDVLTSKNPDDLHGYVSSLAEPEVDQLVAYVAQLDSELPQHRLPFEPPLSEGGAGGGGAGGVAGSTGGKSPGSGGLPAGGAGMTNAGGLAAGGMPAGSGGSANAGAPSSPGTGDRPSQPSCACRVGNRSGSARSGALPADLSLLWLGLMGLASVRRRHRAARRRARSKSLLGALALALIGCGSEPGPSAPPLAQGGMGVTSGAGGMVAGGATGGASGSAGAALPPVTHPDPELARLGTRDETRQRLCARGAGDPFAKALCGTGAAPAIGSLAELLELAGLGTERLFALTANSTSLVSKSVSAINPRMLVFPRVDGEGQPLETMTAVGFVRGEQLVEIVSRDPLTDDLNFYVVAFEQACSYTDAGCDLTSLLSEEIEHAWTAYSVYDQDDLEVTSFDCLSCHRPGGVGTKRILRMQELSSPWMHWFPQRFVQRTDSDRVLGALFAEAHQVDTQYGGIPLAVIMNALDEGSGAQLEALLRAEGFSEQPNPFDAQIATEMKSGTSPTWQARFDAHLRGEAIAVPYPLLDVTDPIKRAAAVRSYLDVAAGTAPRESLLDIRQVFSDDAAEKLSFAPKPGADGRAVLLQMCSRCHDGRGNPALLKNQFDVVRLESMSRATKDRAIERINATDERRMPPWRAGDLTPEAMQAAIAELLR